MFLGLPDLDPSLFCTDPDPSIKQKKFRKTFISTILWLIFVFLSKKTDMNGTHEWYPLKVPNKQRNFLKK